MNAASQRIALAKWMGWTNIGKDVANSDVWRHTRSKFTFVTTEQLPNYSASLDACGVVEANLTDEQRIEYCKILSRHPAFCRARFKNVRTQTYLLISATAAQRCEALCRALGLWTEE